jgi:hypothetical protein
MDQKPAPLDVIDTDKIESAKDTISILAMKNGIIEEREPIDDLVEAAARLSDAEAKFDRTERLLILLGRRGIISDEERFVLHAAYLQQKANGRRIQKPGNPGRSGRP